MKKKSWAGIFVSVLLIIICLAPFGYVWIRSFVTPEGSITLKYYYEVFFANGRYLFNFWRSLLLTLCIAGGQVVASTLAGYGFAKCRFYGKNLMFFLLMGLMILPVQVTLVPNYTILDSLGLINTYYALALPAIFVPLGTFIMTQSFKSVSDEVIDAAKLDGCNTFGVLMKIAVPMNKNGLVCVMLLSFLDGWNMVEQPIVYIKQFSDYPIAVALASVALGDVALQLVCCLLVVIPPLFLFMYFNQELVDGIALGGEK